MRPKAVCRVRVNASRNCLNRPNMIISGHKSTKAPRLYLIDRVSATRDRQLTVL
jgi:hypothetical protein